MCPRDANNLNGLIDYIQYMRSLSSENGNVVLKTAEMDIGDVYKIQPLSECL